MKYFNVRITSNWYEWIRFSIDWKDENGRTEILWKWYKMNAFEPLSFKQVESFVNWYEWDREDDIISILNKKRDELIEKENKFYDYLEEWLLLALEYDDSSDTSSLSSWNDDEQNNFRYEVKYVFDEDKKCERELLFDNYKWDFVNELWEIRRVFDLENIVNYSDPQQLDKDRYKLIAFYEMTNNWKAYVCLDKNWEIHKESLLVVDMFDWKVLYKKQLLKTSYQKVYESSSSYKEIFFVKWDNWDLLSIILWTSFDLKKNDFDSKKVKNLWKIDFDIIWLVDIYNPDELRNKMKDKLDRKKIWNIAKWILENEIDLLKVWFNLVKIAQKEELEDWTYNFLMNYAIEEITSWKIHILTRNFLEINSYFKYLKEENKILIVLFWMIESISYNRKIEMFKVSLDWSKIETIKKEDISSILNKEFDLISANWFF